MQKMLHKLLYPSPKILHTENFQIVPFFIISTKILHLIHDFALRNHLAHNLLSFSVESEFSLIK